jgi:HEAT repeat protein
MTLQEDDAPLLNALCMVDWSRYLESLCNTYAQWWQVYTLTDTSILDLIQDFLQRHDPNLTVDAETLKSWLRQGQLLLLVDGLNELPSEEARRDLHKLRQDYQKTTPMIFTTRDLGVGGDLDIAKKLEMQPLSEEQMQQFVRAYLPEQGEQMLRQLGSRLREFGQTPLLLWMLCSLFKAMGKVPPNLGLVFRQFAQSYYGKTKQDVPVTEESRDWCQLLLEQLAFRMTQGREKTELQVAISKQEAEEILTAFLRDEGLEQPRNRALKWLKDLLKHHLIQLGAGNQIEFRHQLIQEYYTAEYLLKVLTPPTPLVKGGARDSDSLIGGEARDADYSYSSPLSKGGLRGVSDDDWKRDYLNYLKWTEPLTLMLELVEDETQAVRVVKLALEVDLRLGARLAGAVQPKWQEQTVALVAGLEIHLLLKVQFLGITKAESAIPILIKALQDENPSIRERAAYSLGNIGTEASIASLSKALLEDEDSSVRERAAYSLGNIGTEASIASLSKALLEDEDSSVREVAVHSLGNIGSNTTIPCLIQGINDEDYSVHISAANALIKIGSKLAISSLIKCLESIEDDRRYNAPASAVAILGRIGSKAVIPCLIKYLKNNYVRGYTRGQVAYVLVEIGLKEASDALEQALEDKDYYVREVATDALKKIEFKTKNIELNNDTNKLLEDKKSSIKEKVSDVLGKIDSEKAIPSLIKVLNDKEYYVRIRGVEALGEIGSEEAISILIKALDDKEYYDRSKVAETLGEIGSTKVIPSLIKALDDESYYVRSKVAEALGEIGSTKVIPSLIKALDDEASSVRSEAVEALGKIGSEEAIPSLIHSLEDKEPSIPGKAADALSKIGSEAAIPLLTKALEDEDFVAANQGNTLNQATKALQAIQNRYKLYNPTLIQPIPTSEPQPNIPPIQPISTSLMHILHLSDLHFGTPDQANLWSNQLAADLYNDLSIPHLDALILSGDIANYSTQEEYKAAEQFLHNLHPDFPLNPEQIILVPGNHDLNWKLAKKAYKLIDRDDYDGQLKDGHYIEESASVIRIRDEAEYKQRFAHFSQFYETIKQKPYPLDYDQQYTLDHLKEQNLLILGLNSAWQLDHHYKSRASINMGALTNALTQIRRNPDYKNCLKIAVWHHPLDSAYSYAVAFKHSS